MAFVRFGPLPPEKSYITVLSDGYTSEITVERRSWNAREQKYEAGVSVYPAEEKEGKIIINLTGIDPVSAMFIADGRTPYLVTGEEIGKGSDGEPLLSRAEIVRQITEDVFFSRS